MIYAGTKQEIETKRKAFIREWRLKCEAVADSLEEAGNKLFTFPRFPESQWKSIRTSNGIERLHEEWIKTQTVLPSAETAAMLFWALLASGQITMTAPVAKTINTLLGAPSLIWMLLRTSPIRRLSDSIVTDGSEMIRCEGRQDFSMSMID